jgi:hypothetical protein
MAFSSKAPFNPGDKVRTTFRAYDAEKIRVVEDCYISPYSQTGWMVKVEGEMMGLDAEWFQKAED